MKSSLGSAILEEKPNVKWDDVAGLEGAKDALKEAVILPVKFPQVRLLGLLGPLGRVGRGAPWAGPAPVCPPAPQGSKRDVG